MQVMRDVPNYALDVQLCSKIMRVRDHRIIPASVVLGVALSSVNGVTRGGSRGGSFPRAQQTRGRKIASPKIFQRP